MTKIRLKTVAVALLRFLIILIVIYREETRAGRKFIQ